jgi:membrane associated rhomboid family serine protease
MLEDRSYMKEPVFGPRQSITVTLLIVIGACYVLQSILLSYSQGGRELVLDDLALSDEALRRGHIWQFLTFQFLHADFVHVLLNGLCLFFIGKYLERTISSAHFLKLYFGAGVAGGLVQALGNLVLPYNFPTPVVGASAGVSGLLAFFCCLYPAQEIYLFFVLRFPARFFFIISVILSIFFILVPAGGAGLGYAHGAHLGGLLFGYAYARWFLHFEWKMPRLPSISFRKPKIFVHKRQPNTNTWPAEKPAHPEVPSEEFISQEVDPILDKISAHGIQSLTERERKILEAARARMAKR